MEVPSMTCALIIERLTTTSRECYKSATLSLARNAFREVVIVLEAAKTLQKKFVVNYDELEIHRKFAAEGKASITSKALGLRLMVSNAPPHKLVQFLKIMAAKLSGNRLLPRISARKKLLSDKSTNVVQEISPVTLKDVQNLKDAEQGRKGLLKMDMSSPVSSGKAKKRTRLEESVSASPCRFKRRSVEALTVEQSRVLQSVKEGLNVFFTGGAGVGKSFLVKKVIGALPPDGTVVTASTGVAAFGIGGVTLHSFAGVGSATVPLEQLVESAKRRRGIQDNWRKCRRLIIDEISMVDGELFGKLEALARALRDSDKPFGGIQLILTGDFCQLPPVSRYGKKATFCFESKAWSKCNLANFELTIVKRQRDKEFIRVLNELRMGRCSAESERLLRASATTRANTSGVAATELCTHTQEAARINAMQLASLRESQSVTFSAIDSDESAATAALLNSQTPVQKRLELKVGAQVMLVKNRSVTGGLVNGARGLVVAFSPKTSLPVVRFLGGREEEVGHERWAVRSSATGVATRKQLPLRLAWAFSVHKSQGMTLDYVRVSLSRVFEYGQAYVALSRAKSLEGLTVENFDRKCIAADPRVIQFYSKIGMKR